MFHFVDQILRLEPGRRVVAVKHVTGADLFLDSREGGGATLRSCIVGEALGQAGAWVVMQANDFTLRPVAGIARDIELCGTAALGDEIRLETTVDSFDESAMTYRAVATVGGKKIFEIGEGLGPMLPLSDFNDPDELRARLGRIHREAEEADAPTSTPLSDELRAEAGASIEPDEVIAWEEGRSATVRKTIVGDWPFFVDHFPRKPVFPMTLLLETLLQTGGRLLAAPLRPGKIRRVKMNRFLEPGCEVTLVADVRSSDERGAQLRFRCEVEGQRVCVADVDYAPAEIPA